MPTRILIIGFGNALRSDDGFGPRVARELLQRSPIPDTEILVRHCLLPELACHLAEVDGAVFVDAALEGLPGELSLQSVSASDSSPPALAHTLTPGTLLALAGDLYGHAPRSCLLTVGGVSFDGNCEELTPAVARCIKPAVELIRELLRSDLRWAQDQPRTHTSG